MTYLTTANTSLGLGLSGGERREVIVEDKLLGLLYENLVHLLHVHLCSEGDGGKGLCLTTGEYSRAVSARQTVNLAPDRTYLCGLTTVHTKALVEDKIPQSLSLFVTEISVDHHLLGILLLFGQTKRLDALLLDGLESVLSLVLRPRGLGESVALVVGEIVDLLLEILVLLVVRIVSLDILAELLVELFLDAAVLLDLLVGELDGLRHNILGNLLHLTLDHHDVLLGGGDHKLKVGLFHLAEVRVDLELSVDPCHTYLRDRPEERNVAGSQSG